MLHAMQQPSASGAPTDSSLPLERKSSPSPTFAGLMATLAASTQTQEASTARSMPPGPKSTSAWNEDDLADDVATLSYESALKAHARYRYADQSLTQLPDPAPFPFEKASSAAPAAASQPALGFDSAPCAGANPAPGPSRLQATLSARNLKDASITIRMSREECVQLHQRAAEAGLTLSAYLRSCTFEAESLRAMVKDTMAQLRSATIAAEPACPAPPARSLKLADKLAHIFTPWHRSQRAARA